jgi:hypothetical protein
MSQFSLTALQTTARSQKPSAQEKKANPIKRRAAELGHYVGEIETRTVSAIPHPDRSAACFHTPSDQPMEPSAHSAYDRLAPDKT